VLLGAGEGGVERYSRPVVSICVDRDPVKNGHLNSGSWASQKTDHQASSEPGSGVAFQLLTISVNSEPQ
jgi:hypothetical protein